MIEDQAEPRVKDEAALAALIDMNRLISACKARSRRLHTSDPELVAELQDALALTEISLLRLMEAADADSMVGLLD